MNRSFFWVACGDRYVAEAIESAKRAKRFMPDIGRFLLTDKRIRSYGVFNPVKAMSAGEGPWFLKNVRYYHHALHEFEEGDQLVALDSDAYLLAPAYELFDVLERFDFVGVHEGPRQTGKTASPIPDAFSEFNVGILAFRNNERVRGLFGKWLRLYEENVNVYGDNDQSSLREAIWLDKSGLQIHVMPSEFNCRFHFGTYVHGQVRAIHGGTRNIGKVAKALNDREWKTRAWQPKELLRL